MTPVYLGRSPNPKTTQEPNPCGLSHASRPTYTRPSTSSSVIHLSADKTRKDKRSRKHPLGLVNRDSKHSPYHFGLEMVLLIASWAPFRIPIRLAVMAPQIKGHQNILFRQMLETVALPSWVRASMSAI